jgi:hypothetical protein
MSLLRKNIKTVYAGHSGKMSGMLTHGVELLHENVHPHRAARTGVLPQSISWQLTTHLKQTNKKHTNSVALSPRANYTD